MRIDASGQAGPTRHQANSAHWRRSSHGLFVPSYVELTPQQRVLEAATRLPPGQGAVTGWAALCWIGARWFGGSTATDVHGLPVDLAVRQDIRPQPGIYVCAERMHPDERMVLDGLRITIPVRSVVYMMRRARSVRAAVETFDMAAYDDLVSIEETKHYVGPAPTWGLSGWTGVPQCREALGLVDENAWSPQEVAMQLVWVLDAGLPTPLLNQPVFDLQGRHIGTPDLLELHDGVFGQYDGRLHLADAQRRQDRESQERFRSVGLEGFTLFAGDMADRRRTAERMLAARDRARRLSPQQRLWTIEPPHWWLSTTTVDSRRSLSLPERDRLLRYRNAA